MSDLRTDRETTPDYQAQLDAVLRKALAFFEEKEKAREEALVLHRQTVKLSGNAIKLMHRREYEKAEALMSEAAAAVDTMASVLPSHPDVYHAGFIQTAQKEYAEARVFQAVVLSKPIPAPKDLKVDPAPYLNGLGEAVGELRRYVLDNLRRGCFEPGETILQIMDDIYYVLMGVDYTDALTLGLRRTADVARSLIEKTRGELTTALQQQRLEQALKKGDRSI